MEQNEIPFEEECALLELKDAKESAQIIQQRHDRAKARLEFAGAEFQLEEIKLDTANLLIVSMDLKVKEIPYEPIVNFYSGHAISCEVCASTAFTTGEFKKIESHRKEVHRIVEFINFMIGQSPEVKQGVATWQSDGEIWHAQSIANPKIRVYGASLQKVMSTIKQRIADNTEGDFGTRFEMV